MSIAEKFRPAFRHGEYDLNVGHGSGSALPAERHPKDGSHYGLPLTDFMQELCVGRSAGASYALCPASRNSWFCREGWGQ